MPGPSPPPTNSYSGGLLPEQIADRMVANAETLAQSTQSKFDRFVSALPNGQGP